MKKILITGGAGFIGSTLTEKLLSKEQFHVTCIDNFDSYYPKTIKEQNIAPFLKNANYALINGDIRNSKVFKQVGNVDTIIHLAAKVGVRSSIRQPKAYYATNVLGTQNTLEFAKMAGVEQFVFGSSSSVYGSNKNLPWHEDQQAWPVSPYASSKLSCEALGHVYSQLYNIRFLSLRFFTVYGPRQRPDLVIHKYISHRHEGRSFSIFGDGSSARDYTYIDDIVSGIIAAAEYQESMFEIINLGTGTATPISYLLKIIDQVCGFQGAVQAFPDQLGDLKSTQANISKAKDLLGHSPSVNLKEGIERFYDWFKSKENEKRSGIT